MRRVVLSLAILSLSATGGHLQRYGPLLSGVQTVARRCAAIRQYTALRSPPAWPQYSVFGRPQARRC